MRTNALVVLLVLASCLPDGTELLEVQPRLLAEQTELDMGEVDAGQELGATAWFVNVGDAPVHLQARVEGGDGRFSVRSGQAVLAPGDRFGLAVRFVAFAPDIQAHALLMVDHDGQPSGDGARTLRVELKARIRPVASCDDHNPCTLDAPDPAHPTQCLYQPVYGPCDDGNACTTGDRCEAGTCYGQAIPCDDGVECTADSCDPVLGCVSRPTHSWCDDGDPCTVDECNPGVLTGTRGCVHRVAANGTLCGAPSCQALPMCLEGACVSVAAPDGYLCSDGNACTVEDFCQGGVCHPGQAGLDGNGVPVLVRQAFHTTEPHEPGSQTDAPLFGQWVMSLDALAMTWEGGAPEALLLWTGAQGDNAMTCFRVPARCANQPVPFAGDSPATMLNINLSTAELDGETYRNHVLSLDRVYQVAQGPAVASACSNIPQGVVTQVAGVGGDGAVWGAAVVRYNGQCAIGGVPFSAGEQPPPVLTTEFTVLTVFQGTYSGLSLIDAVLLGISEQPVLATGRDGRPLLAVDRKGDTLAVAFAVQDGDYCEPGPGADKYEPGDRAYCGVNHLIMHTRSYELTSGAYSVHMAGDIYIPKAADPVGELGVFLWGGLPQVLWLQQATQESQPESACDPGSIYGCPQTASRYDLWKMDMCMAGGGICPQPTLVANWVNGMGRVRDGYGWKDILWSRRGEVGAICNPVDRVIQQHSAWSEPLLQRLGSDGPMITAVRVDSVNGSDFFLAAQTSGSLLVISPGFEEQATRQHELVWPADSRNGMFPGAAPHLDDLGGTMVVASVAEVEIYRNSLPTPALSLTVMGCGVELEEIPGPIP